MTETETIKIDELTKAQLVALCTEQAVFTEGLRRVANVALANAGHIISNYARRVPDNKLSDWHKAMIDANALLMQPAPVQPPPLN